MSLAPIPFIVQSPGTGQAISGATVVVAQHPSGTPAVLYQDEAGTTPLTPASDRYTTDSLGRATFGGNQIWVPSGRYDLTISGPTLTTTTITRDFFSTQHQNRVGHTWASDDQTSPNSNATVLAQFTVSYSSQETGTLYGVYHLCKTVGGTPSVFAIQTDHGAHGTFSNVAGLTGITPAAAGAVLVQPTGGPMALAEGDTVRLVTTTPGNSTGLELTTVEERTFP